MSFGWERIQTQIKWNWKLLSITIIVFPTVWNCLENFVSTFCLSGKHENNCLSVCKTWLTTFNNVLENKDQELLCFSSLMQIVLSLGLNNILYGTMLLKSETSFWEEKNCQFCGENTFFLLTLCLDLEGLQIIIIWYNIIIMRGVKWYLRKDLGKFPVQFGNCFNPGGGGSWFFRKEEGVRPNLEFFLNASPNSKYFRRCLLNTGREAIWTKWRHGQRCW